jgi:hypothetical protein
MTTQMCLKVGTTPYIYNENIVTKLYCTEDLLMHEIRMFIIFKAGVIDLHI